MQLFVIYIFLSTRGTYPSGIGLLSSLSHVALLAPSFPSSSCCRDPRPNLSYRAITYHIYIKLYIIDLTPLIH